MCLRYEDRRPDWARSERHSPDLQIRLRNDELSLVLLVFTHEIRPSFHQNFFRARPSSLALVAGPPSLLACPHKGFASMAQPSTPAGTPHSIFGNGASSSSNANNQVSTVITPSSAVSSNNTFLMPNSPAKGRLTMDGYRPKVTRTLGQRPACLVNASVTFCGNNQIYAFGGFDQYTDEVYNHVLRLDMVSHQWSLVDNYGDIPGVRMGKFCPMSQIDSINHDSRPHCHIISRRQAFDLWRRERTPNLPLRSNYLRS